MEKKFSRQGRQTPDSFELFTFMASRWDVRKAKQLVQNREVSLTANPNDLSGMMGLIRIDEEHAMSEDVDLTVPLLVVRFKANPRKRNEEELVLLIDGWHRVFKALKQGLTSLPIHLIENKEAQKLRIR